MSKNILDTDFAAQADLTSLEQQVLMQYQSLAVKLNSLSDEIAKLNKHILLAGQGPVDPTSGLADGLLTNMRNLERRIGLVYTLFRTAVYSLLLQNQDNREKASLENAPQDEYAELLSDLSEEVEEGK